MDIVLTVLVIISVLVVAAIIAWILYEVIDNNTNNLYKKLPFDSYYVGKGKNMRKCPKGCVRGVCKHNKYCRNHYPPHPKCCAFDFQCQYCRDQKTGEYYLEPGDDDYIDKNYYKDGNDFDRQDLNRDIMKENRYIRRINKDIRRKNKKIMKRENM